jgi:hypothetical protein
MAGDTSQGQFTQYYHGSGFTEGSGRSYTYNPDPCSDNPLYSSTCPGYAEAYLAQQCTANPLYAPSCPGYADAYYAQQCTINPLYDRTCPGFAEAYALANVVPSTSNQTISTTTPTLQISTTGTITFDTPVVADPVVNEVITRPATTSTSTARASEPVAQTTPAPAEKKSETKAETKQEVKQTVKPQVKTADGKTIEMPTIVQTPVKIEQVQLIDLLARKMVSKPMNTNPRAYYLMTLGGQRTHEDMIDEQYRR